MRPASESQVRGLLPSMSCWRMRSCTSASRIASNSSRVEERPFMSTRRLRRRACVNITASGSLSRMVARYSICQGQRILDGDNGRSLTVPSICWIDAHPKRTKSVAHQLTATRNATCTTASDATCCAENLSQGLQLSALSRTFSGSA